MEGNKKDFGLLLNKWDEIKRKIQVILNISSEEYDKWIEPLTVQIVGKIEGDARVGVTISVPNSLAHDYDYLCDQYKEPLEKALEKIMGEPYIVDFVLDMILEAHYIVEQMREKKDSSGLDNKEFQAYCLLTIEDMKMMKKALDKGDIDEAKRFVDMEVDNLRYWL